MRRRLVALALLALLGVAVAAVGFSGASFSSTSSNPQTARAVADFVAPSIGTPVLGKSASAGTGGQVGAVRAGGSYWVWVDPTDSGNPPAGVRSVEVDPFGTGSRVTATSTGGPFTAGNGRTYAYRAGPLTAPSSPANTTSPAPYTVRVTDNADNLETAAHSNFVVDSTPPVATAVGTANGAGGTPGRAEAGDTVTFTFDSAVDANAIVSGWYGSQAPSSASNDPTNLSVLIRAANGAKASDGLEVQTASGSTLPLGTVDLGGRYASKNVTFTGSALTQGACASTGPCTFTVTLGTVSKASDVSTNTTSAPYTWTPSASITDRAGNALAAASVTTSSVVKF